MESTVLLEKIDTTAIVWFNDARTYNAFDLATITAFANHLIALAYDDQVKAVIISGKGRAFCTGGNLKWAASFPGGPSVAFHQLSSRFHQAVAEIRNMKKPVVAAINGIAAGGGFSLALACDFRLMARSATLKQGYTSNGLSVDGGGTFTLPRLIGLARALEVIAFDDPITAEGALNWGLVNRIVDDGGLMEACKEFLKKMSKISFHSFGWSKQLLNCSTVSSLEEQMEREREGLSTCGGHPDGIEGINALMEKRTPVFGK
jgi:2-(1,2-epoxy-1,2-dihydrophenyl)acetyl-CoA isomerase